MYIYLLTGYEGIESLLSPRLWLLTEASPRSIVRVEGTTNLLHETYKQELATNMPKQTCNVILNFILFNLYPPCYEANSSHFTRTLEWDTNDSFRFKNDVYKGFLFLLFRRFWSLILELCGIALFLVIEIYTTLTTSLVGSSDDLI
jgi:hypothetical protein